MAFYSVSDETEAFSTMPRYTLNPTMMDPASSSGIPVSLNSFYHRERDGHSHRHPKHKGQVWYLNEEHETARFRFRQDGEQKFVSEGYYRGPKVGEDWAFVLDQSYRMHALPKKKCYCRTHGEDEMRHVHHSSFTGGQPVLAAGTFTLRDDGVMDFCPKTGHYGKGKSGRETWNRRMNRFFDAQVDRGHLDRSFFRFT